jgi:hypothetical protein
MLEGLLIWLQTQNLTQLWKTWQQLAGLLQHFQVLPHRLSLGYTTKPYGEIKKSNELPPRILPRY